MHCVGELLENLPGLAQSAGLTEDQVAAVQDAVDKMFDAYSTVDDAIHSGQRADYSSVSGTLDESMMALEQAVSEAGPAN
jgi:hypothetical protein